MLPLHFFKSEVWELIKFQSSQPEYFLPSHLAPTYSLALRSECLQHPTPKSGLHTPPPPRPPLMTCAFYTKTVIQNPLCRLMFTLCHCLDRNLLLRIRFALFTTPVSYANPGSVPDRHRYIKSKWLFFRMSLVRFFRRRKTIR